MSDMIGQITLSVLQITLTGLKLCQQNQRCQCSEDLLESYGIEKLPKSTKICQILQKSQFKQFLYWKVGSLLYVKCGWFCPQKHKTECLSSIICDYTGFWKWDKLQKVRNYGSKTHFWSPISSEQCFEIHISHINLKIWAEMVPEILKSNNLKIP